jgi:hypothetical protein
MCACEPPITLSGERMSSLLCNDVGEAAKQSAYSGQHVKLPTFVVNISLRNS